MNPSVFVVDDEQLVTFRIKSVLEEYGFRTQSAASCRECLEMLEQGYAPQVVLIDVDLGEGNIDGAETARRIVRRYDLPVVFFSGHTDPEILAKTEGIRAYGYVYKDAGTDEFLVSTINMAIRLHRSETLLRESEEKFRTIFENSPIGLFRSTPEGRVLDVNQALAEMLGYGSPEEVLDSIYDIAKQIYVRTNDRKGIVSETVSEDQIHHYENVYRRRDGSHFTANLYLKAIKDEWGTTRYLEGIVEDLTDRLEAERRLEEKNELFLQAIEVMHEGLLIIDEDGRIEQANRRAEEILGRSLEELRGLVLWSVEQDWQPVHLDGGRFNTDELPSLLSLHTGEKRRHVPMGVRRPDGQRVWLSINTEALGGENSTTGVVVSFRDMTTEFTYQREIETILTDVKRLSEERKNLLLEMNHRIKNNLFTVEALSKIELSNSEKNKEESIRDIIGRVQAISLVHQKLYSTGNFTSIDTAGYLEDLGSSLSKALSSEAMELCLHSDVEDMRLSSKKVSALGIIFVELLTNTQKYSGCTERCDIFISLCREGENAVFEYRDNGKGFGDEVHSLEDVSSGTGFMLIRALMGDLEGELELIPQVSIPTGVKGTEDKTEKGPGGVHLRLTFPLPSNPAEDGEE